MGETRKNKDRREVVEEIMRAVGAEVEIEEIRKIGENRERGEETVWI